MKNGAELTASEVQALVKEPPKRVALVALGMSAYDYIQHCDRTGNRRELFDETWTVNTFCNLIESDRLFHMDDIRVQQARAVKNVRVRAMLESMKQYKGPIITSVPHPDYPQCVAFPLTEVITKFGGSLYFNNTMPYAIAYAMLIGVKELTMFGMDYVWPNMAEAEAGRACTEYWIAKAQCAGIVTRVAQSSTLMDARLNAESIQLYGYDAYEIRLEWRGASRYALLMKDKPLPDPDEVERKYYKDAPKTLEAILGKQAEKQAEQKADMVEEEKPT